MKTLSSLRAFALLAAFALVQTSFTHAILDTNTNGMSDLWEKQHNNGVVFPATFLAAADDDKDGWTNATEAIAGTDPFQPNPPNGIIATTIEPTSTEGAFTLTWPTNIGKNYRLQASSNLTDWLNVGTAIIGTTNSHTLGISAVQPDTTVPPKLFWRIVATDLDSDGDGLTNAEENTLGTDPNEAQTVKGINDLWIAQHFSQILLSQGLTGLALNGDADNDGKTNAEEYLDGTDPQRADATETQRWMMLNGTGLEDVIQTRSRTVTIPANSCMLVVVATASDEYSEFTAPDAVDEYNDVITWEITPSGESSIEGEVNVNDRHVDWLIAEVNNHFIAGISKPIHYEAIKVVKAPTTASMTINVEVSVKNVGDGSLPSHIAIGLLPIQLCKAKIDQVTGIEIQGQLEQAADVKITKMEPALTVIKNQGVIQSKEYNIGKDYDRRYLKISGGASLLLEESLLFSLSTYGTGDSVLDESNYIEMKIDGSDYLSKPFVFVSDEVDDDYSGAIDVVADDSEGDQTHYAKLGGKCKINALKIGDDVQELNISYPFEVVKKIPVDFVILQGANTNVDDMKQTIERDLAETNVAFAQLGIQVTKKSLTVAALPANLPLVDGKLKLLGPSIQPSELGEGVKKLISDFGTQPEVDDIHVFYTDLVMLGGIGGTDGFAINYIFSELNPGYLNNIFMNKMDYERSLAHELGHCIGNLGHATVTEYAGTLNEGKHTHNVMYDYPVDNKTLFDTKRFIRAQEVEVFKSSVLINP